MSALPAPRQASGRVLMAVPMEPSGPVARTSMQPHDGHGPREERASASAAGTGLLRSMWRFRIAILATTLVAGAIGYGASLLQAPQYEATAELMLADPRNVGVFRDAQQVALDPARHVRNRAEMVTSSPVLTGAADLLGGRLDQVTLAEQVSAEPSFDLDLVTIHAIDDSAAGAAEVADAVARSYEAVASRQGLDAAEAATTQLGQTAARLEARRNALEAQLATDPGNPALEAERDAAVAQLVSVQTRAEQITVDATLFGSGVELYEPAALPTAPARPKPLRNAAVAAVLGLAAASAVAWRRAELRLLADDRRDPATVLGAPLLGAVPEFSSAKVRGPVPAATAPRSAVAEDYQVLVASLLHALDRVGGNTVLLTSASPSEGKTVTALNLGLSAMRDGRRVTLVDADERMRGLTRLAGLGTEAGLTDLADDQRSFDDCVRSWEVADGAPVSFVSAGSALPTTAGFFLSAAFRKSVTRIREQSDLAVFDSAPLLAVADGVAIAAQMDGVVVVVARGTPLDHLEDLRERIALTGVPLLGYVFNRAQPGQTGSYGYGGYGGDESDARGRRGHRAGHRDRRGRRRT